MSEQTVTQTPRFEEVVTHTPVRDVVLAFAATL